MPASSMSCWIQKLCLSMWFERGSPSGQTRWACCLSLVMFQGGSDWGVQGSQVWVSFFPLGLFSWGTCLTLTEFKVYLKLSYRLPFKKMTWSTCAPTSCPIKHLYCHSDTFWPMETTLSLEMWNHHLKLAGQGDLSKFNYKNNFYEVD